MLTDNARILVIGAGVNGSIGAVGLHQAGFNVTVLARGKRFEELQEGGIIIEDAFTHTRTVTRVPVIGYLDPADCYDYVLVMVRKSQVADLLPILARNGSPNVVFMVNNPSGPDAYVTALGRDRVMLGFVFGAGRRVGDTIHAFILRRRRGSTPFGEIDGTITPRLTRLVSILNQAGLQAETSRHIVDWQSTHATPIAALALLIMKYQLDVKALAASGEDLGLMVDAMRESLDVLTAVGYRITPGRNRIVKYIPRFLLIFLLRKALPTRFFEVGAVWHVSQAPDEMNQIAAEVAVLVEKSGLPVPALRKVLEMKPRV